jgi:RNA polymerase sigma factor (sigma-70 family)
MLTDNSLMLKVKEGDLDKMGLLFERYHRQLYGFLFHMTYKKEVAEDMVQHTFYKMLKYRNSFTGSGEFVHWMYTVARNVLKDEYKKMKRAQLHDDVDDISDILPGGVHTGDLYGIAQGDGKAERRPAPDINDEPFPGIETPGNCRNNEHDRGRRESARAPGHAGTEEYLHQNGELNSMKMECEQYQDLFTDYMNKQLLAADKAAFEQHLAGCPACAEELQALQQVWNAMEEVTVPEPSADMSHRFNAMLANYKASVTEEVSVWDKLKEQWEQLWAWQPRWPMAYNIAVMVVGLAAGLWFLKSSKSNDTEKLAALTDQVHELKQTMMLSLLENPSASERIRGVSYTSEIKHADKEVIDALFATLNNDPNVNVRLSTLEALTGLANHPEVREGLVRSITQQDSPLLQSAIADVMLKLQEKSSVGSFRKLLKQKNLDQGVKQKINKTISSLI